MPLDNPDERPEQEWPDLSPAANVGTTSPGPEALSEEAPPVEEPQPVTGEASPSEETERAAEGTAEEPLPEFDPQYRQELDGLMFIGKLDDDFEWLGHKFVIRTLINDEVLEVGLLHREFTGSLGELRAYQMLMAAACIVTVDGQRLPTPITNEDGDTPVRNRFNYVRTKWFPPTIDAVYNHYLELETKVARLVEKMGEAYG